MKTTSRRRTVTKATRKRPELDIQPVAKISRPRSWVFYGRSGTGKTTLASTFPKPILLVDVKDQGTDSVMDVSRLDVAQISSWEEAEEIYYFLKENKKYKTVIIDTVSQVQQLCMEDVVLANRRNVDRVGDWGTMTKRDWGAVSGRMKDWILDMRDLNMEVVFIAQDRVSNTDDEDASDNQLLPEVGPRLMPSVAAQMNAAVSIIGNTFIRSQTVTKEVRGRKVKKERAVYCLRVGPNPVYTTKLRKPKSVAPPAFIEDPTYQDILEVMEGK